MCGRYASSRQPEDLVEEFEVEQAELPAPLPADYNVAPTKEVYAVLERPPRREPQRPSQRQLRVLTWGLVPSWAKDPGIGNRMSNARVETVAEKPAYRKAFAARRCLLPADGYYEWYSPEAPETPQSAADASSAGPGRPKVRKQPFFIRPADGSGPAARLTDSTATQYPNSWSPDGMTLIFEQEEAAQICEQDQSKTHQGKEHGSWQEVHAPGQGNHPKIEDWNPARRSAHVPVEKAPDQ